MKDKYDLEESLKRANKSSIMIGSFKNERGVFSMAGTNHVLMFDVLPLCEDPSIVNNNYTDFKEVYDYEQKYTAFIRDQNEKVLPYGYDGSGYDYEQQKKEIFEYYNNQLIIFQPYYRYENKDEIYHKNLKVLDVVEKPTWLKDDEKFFKIVPKININKKSFEKKIKKNEYFSLDYFPGDVYDSLDYICCGDYLYFSDSWKANENDTTNWKFDNTDGDGIIKSTKIDNVREIIESNSRIASNFLIIYETALFDINERMEDLKFDEDVLLSITNNQTNIEESVIEENDEYAMITSFRENVINSNLCYDFEDLVNLHTCAKSSSLTILAGMSGTGKTQLALQYAKMLDTQELNNTLLFMPITPSYTEPDDVLGYLNPTNALYTPSETGLVDFLVNAQNNPTKMHMVIFDEMNLSQIEYWFSPFISVLEKDVETRYLPLYNEKSYCVNKATYPSSIKIGNNIIFIGTINLDETTKEISDRLLDRAYVINLKKKKFIDFYSQDLTQDQAERPNLKTCDNSSLFNQWRTDIKPIKAFNKDELSFLDELHEIISRYDEQKGVSFRVLKNIGNYINNIPCDNEGKKLISKSVAFDLVLKQTVMKKISGPDNRLKEMIGTIKHIGDEPENSLIIELFEKYNTISDFTECKKSIRRKAEDLFAYGYTR